MVVAVTVVANTALAVGSNLVAVADCVNAAANEALANMALVPMAVCVATTVGNL